MLFIATNFFFSSRRRHTRSLRDWSSDVCSSDLHGPGARWQPFELRLATGRDTALTVSWSTDWDPRPRPFPLRRFLLPWAQPPDGGDTAPAERSTPEIAGGRWLRGKEVFF